MSIYVNTSKWFPFGKFKMYSILADKCHTYVDLLPLRYLFGFFSSCMWHEEVVFKGKCKYKKSSTLSHFRLNFIKDVGVFVGFPSTIKEPFQLAGVGVDRLGKKFIDGINISIVKTYQQQQQ